MQRITNRHGRARAGAASARARMLSVLLVATGGLVLVSLAASPLTPPGLDRDDADRAAADETRLLVEDMLEALVDDPRPRAAGDDDDDDRELTLAALKFFIEFNETDEDIGVQCLLGGEPYKVLKAYGPDGRKILEMRPRRGLKQQGLSDFFFESAEPTLDEFPIADFLDRFPEGEYEFETVTIDGIEQDGETMFTHDIPAGPVITSPLEGEVVDPERTIITWEPVTLSTALNPPQRPVTIVGYQVIVTRDDPKRVYSVDVGPDTTAVSVPPEFFEPGTEYELEILAVEVSDNQTISIIFFETE